MKIILVLLIISLFPQKTQQVPIPRNQSWNQAVEEVRQLENSLLEVQKFLKEYEENIKLPVIDVEAMQQLENSVQYSQQLTKRLKQLQKDIEKEAQ